MIQVSPPLGIKTSAAGIGYKSIRTKA